MTDSRDAQVSLPAEGSHPSRPSTLGDLIGGFAASTPSHAALVFLENGEGPGAELTYAELHRRAAALAGELERRGLRGERVLLLLPSGLDYVVSFVGCLYAGVVAVPVYPPRNNWHAERVGVIAHDAGAKATLTLASLLTEVRSRLAAAGSEAVEALIAADEVDFDQPGFVDDTIRPGDLAYLQYTSGSTGNPKGVMVRHGDLLGNCALHAAGVGLTGGETQVSWLPIFHDMGLVEGITMPLTLGGTAVFMPPTAFVQKPVRWLRAISRYRGVFSGGPNFAYELCATKVSDAEAAELDLSCWRGALNGAEPISPRTLRRFAEKFAVSGFRPDALISAYGLAEATLVVSCGRFGEPSPTLHVEKRALEQGRIVVGAEDGAGSQPLVSSGRIRPEFEVRIVDAETGLPCAPDEVGEIWISGGSVCAGYWRHAEATEETFGATLPDRPGRRYLRTGDLGFARDGELYVTGRVKDLIIIRGANHYPQDLERTAETAHPALRRGGWAAAFTLEEGEGDPRLVVVHEVERTERKKVDPAEAGLAIMRAVTEQHGIDVDLVVLVEPAGVPKTSSGKIQRRACRRLLLGGGLREVGRWERPRAAAEAAPTSAGVPG
ncbi:MAG TPA: fatty acyl-AMP ligase, partial [Longimicrobiaceae bacterium]|nr:fatty acyl-AMP ligase [Longimicrobiaceae bacterium]